MIDAEQFAKWQEHGIVLAVSGGADSVALLHHAVQLTALKNQLAVVHVNHGLRSDESDEDATFVRRLAEENQLRYFERRIEISDWENDDTGSIEAAARNFRYRFFTETAEKIGFRYVATAHNADDQVETILHRILRGTGIAGLAGMPNFRQLSAAVTLIRPLLHVRRREILEYLTHHGRLFRTDSSNLLSDHTRNKFRLHYLPKFRSEINPLVDDALLRLAQTASDTVTMIDSFLSEIIEQSVIEMAPDKMVIDKTRLKDCSTVLLRELLIKLWRLNEWPLREMTSVHWQSLAALCRAEQGKNVYPGAIVAETDTEMMRIYR